MTEMRGNRRCAKLCHLPGTYIKFILLKSTLNFTRAKPSLSAIWTKPTSIQRFWNTLYACRKIPAQRTTCWELSTLCKHDEEDDDDDEWISCADMYFWGLQKKKGDLEYLRVHATDRKQIINRMEVRVRHWGVRFPSARAIGILPSKRALDMCRRCCCWKTGLRLI